MSSSMAKDKDNVMNKMSTNASILDRKGQNQGSQIDIDDDDNDNDDDVICCSTTPTTNVLPELDALEENEDSEGSMKLVIDESFETKNRESNDEIPASTAASSTTAKQGIKVDGDLDQQMDKVKDRDKKMKHKDKDKDHDDKDKDKDHDDGDRDKTTKHKDKDHNDVDRDKTTKHKDNDNKDDDDDVTIIEIDDDMDNDLIEPLSELPLSVELYSDIEIIEIDDNDSSSPELENRDSASKEKSIALSSSSSSSSSPINTLPNHLNIENNSEKENVTTIETLRKTSLEERQPLEVIPSSFSMSSSSSSSSSVSIKEPNLQEKDALKNINLPKEINTTLTNNSIDNNDRNDDNNNNNEVSETNQFNHDDGIFYNKYCINYDCNRTEKQFVKAALFALSYYKIQRTKGDRVYFLCMECNLKTIQIYELLYKQMSEMEPMLFIDEPIDRPVVVEISDSSEEESADDSSNKSINSNNNSNTITTTTTTTKTNANPPLNETNRENMMLVNGNDSSIRLNNESLQIVENELCQILENVLKSDKVHRQMIYTRSILNDRVQKMSKDCEQMEQDLSELQSMTKKWDQELYNKSKFRVRHKKPLDIPATNYPSSSPNLYEQENSNELDTENNRVNERPPIQLNETYYVVKNNVASQWVPCKVIDILENNLPGQLNLKQYRVKFLKTQYQMIKTVTAKNLAYYEPPLGRLSVGTRVIASYDATHLSTGQEQIFAQNAFYPGIIAETIKSENMYRYLIFYDDGYTQYALHCDVRLVCQVSDNVWDDIHSPCRVFLEKYLNDRYNQRPLVQAQIGQKMYTQYNGIWMEARVKDIDCSLLLMQFDGERPHCEWIYRGSLRLGPLFREYQKRNKQSSKNNTNKAKGILRSVSCFPRRSEPYVRYTLDEVDNTDERRSTFNSKPKTTTTSTTSSNGQRLMPPRTNNNGGMPRQTARKSTRPNPRNPPASSSTAVAPAATAPATATSSSSTSSSSVTNSSNYLQNLVPQVKHLNNSTIYVDDENKPKGKIVYYMAKRKTLPRKFERHQCSNKCLLVPSHSLRGYSPLSKPLLSGWERLLFRQRIKRTVAYRAPCGRLLRNMKEIHRYLKETNNSLAVDNFDFSPEINCLAEYIIESAIVQKSDISGGQEPMPIPLINYYDNTLPQKCVYSNKVIPTEGVHINKEVDFLVGCDCEDDCMDKTKCSCWKLTLEGASYGNPNILPNDIGYQYKRLLEPVPTGIYECNARCKCSANCLNRVVQNSLQLKLQVFKTSNRGWGLRCINDIPKGTFVCIYAGHLLTEAKANEGGLTAGDEYFAELDYIEVAEQIKEGYESDVDMDPSNYSANTSDQQRRSNGNEELRSGSRNRLMERGGNNTSTESSSTNQHHRHSSSDYWPVDDDVQERQAVNFDPNADLQDDSVRESSMRKLFGKDEACYVMDAKIMGNVGRYFNHSCSPNLFVQNVFVDTHDLRFPWVAFFASCEIRAGSELTWNYNYEVGVVPGKVLYCQCGAANCRVRLL